MLTPSAGSASCSREPKAAAQSRTLAGAIAVARCSWSSSVRLIYFIRLIGVVLLCFLYVPVTDTYYRYLIRLGDSELL
jgi:hypothetical protein